MRDNKMDKEFNLLEFANFCRKYNPQITDLQARHILRFFEHRNIIQYIELLCWAKQCESNRLDSRLKGNKTMKTGDIITMKEKELAVLKTHNDERKDIGFLIQTTAAKGRLYEERFWTTVFDLYPEIKGFDIHINWKKKLITVRGKREELI